MSAGSLLIAKRSRINRTDHKYAMPIQLCQDR
jgi:hypothetical protein